MNKFEKKVAQDKAFHLNNGKTLLSLSELYSEIHEMQDEVFFHHVNEQRNDFANWVKDVMAEKALATKVAKCATPSMLKDVLAPLFAPEKAAKPAAAKAVAPKAAAPKAAAKTVKATAPKAVAPKAAAKKK